MWILLGFVAVAFIILYKRSTEIVVVNPMRSALPEAPVLRGPEDDEPDAPQAPTDLAGLLRVIQQAAQQNAPPAQVNAAVLQLVRQNQFIEAMQLYRRLYNVDLQTAKRAVDKLMLGK